jgi:CBS domain-containing protein
MTRAVVGVKPDAAIDQAIQIMLDHHLSGLPVINDKGALVGVVTEGDFLRRAEIGTERKRSRWLQFLLGSGRLAEEYAHSHGRKVSEVMTSNVVTAAIATPLDEVVELMIKHRIKRVPIVDGSKVVGIVTRSDMLSALRKAAASTPTRPASDIDILSGIRAELDRVGCIPSGLIEASVHNGEVELNGCLTDERQRGAIHVAVENIPGVKGIHDHLVWVEPNSGFVLLSPEDQNEERSNETDAA